jgi:hypothetical protein
MLKVTLFTVTALIMGTASLLIRNTSRCSRCGGEAYERRRARALVAKVFFVAGLLSFSITLLAVFFGPR